jgi:outer membrane protein assembly factor BamE (lipoprotein component of BamABCDE complex)
MLFKTKYHKFIIAIIFLFILVNCQFQDPYRNHGITFLDNRSKKLLVQKTNINDVIQILGQPHSKSLKDDKTWIYIERVLTKGEYHQLGKNILKSNNVLVLEFDKYGVLKDKKLLNKDDIRKISFSKNETINNITQKSFIEKFLSSIKNKMYGNRK